MVDTSSVFMGVFVAPNPRPAYSSEFRQKTIELMRAGRSPEQLAKEFEPSAQTIRNSVSPAHRDDGGRRDSVTTAARQEQTRPRSENKQLKLEREILSKAAA